jgi:hypothetical protein
MAGLKFPGWQANSCPAVPKMVGLLGDDSAVRDGPRTLNLLLNKSSIVELNMTVSLIQPAAAIFSRGTV